MNKALADLIKISNITGKDSTLVQGGGGNTSVKTEDGEYMYIKASGTALKDMNSKKGWRRLRLAPVLSIIEDKSLAKLGADKREPEVVDRLLFACDDNIKDGARPSVESHLHAFLDRSVIHLHPLVVGAFVNAKNGKAEIQKLFKAEKFPPLWVPYADPGFMLAKKIAGLVNSYQKQYGKKPVIMILEKHGIFTTAATAETSLRLVRKVIRMCKSKLKEPKPRKSKPPNKQDVADAKAAIRYAILEVTNEVLPVSFIPTNNIIAAFMQRKDAKKLLATPALNPDELVYANGSAMWLDKCDAKAITRRLRSKIDKAEKPSAAFLIKGLGLFVAADEKMIPVITEITIGSLYVRMQATKFGGILTLTKRQQDFINNWEAETFRKQLVSKTK
jgi:rhamnose utilization protein RhaD (predicted bifunctional aldolase and dehydrogenase)